MLLRNKAYYEIHQLNCSATAGLLKCWLVTWNTFFNKMLCICIKQKVATELQCVDRPAEKGFIVKEQKGIEEIRARTWKVKMEQL